MEVNQRIVDQFYQDTANIKQNIIEREKYLVKKCVPGFSKKTLPYLPYYYMHKMLNPLPTNHNSLNSLCKELSRNNLLLIIFISGQ